MTPSFLPHAPGRALAVLLGMLYGALAVTVLHGASWLAAMGARPRWAIALVVAGGLLSALTALLVLRGARAWVVTAALLAVLTAWLQSPWAAVWQAVVTVRWLVSGPPPNMIIETGFSYGLRFALAESTLVFLGVGAAALWLPSLWRGWRRARALRTEQAI